MSVKLTKLSMDLDSRKIDPVELMDDPLSLHMISSDSENDLVDFMNSLCMNKNNKLSKVWLAIFLFYFY